MHARSPPLAVACDSPPHDRRRAGHQHQFRPVAPPNGVIVSLALFLITAFVMGPAFQSAYGLGVKPLVANEIEP